ncbi:methionyl-tRNA formyltransferase [Pseudoflavonifractor phocaeensis]|uniref:methionyl-tRNA formyltransferase n=1 Tax=Pseudoflavonifractor phocaeensis TaxID=1870988 RepID=UPI001F030B71|nr:methionyl-tRNA formyltransferase [Pseudoflavonifractor phocaeensis]MCF2596429.1 methionyl-tRNA formyltransferase [Pseudoflavonifractor phocaeensis]
MRIVFMGTPDFAVPSLEALIAAGHEVCGVFSQPDKPVGRHQNKLKPTPVKECALAHDIPVFQPAGLRDGEALAQLKELAPELIVVAAYGRLLPDEILALPPKGCINVHSSLLPKYRGSAPIHWAVVNGDKETGVTIMDVVAELDGGDILAQVSTPIDPDETVETVHDRLAALGGELLVKTVAQIGDGTVKRVPQDPVQVTYAPMLSRALSPIDWTQSARAIHNKVRGLNPWPATSTDVISGDTVKIYRSAVLDKTVSAQPGTIVAAGKEGIDIACGDGQVLRVLELQAPGSRRMAAADYLRGHPLS